MPELAGSTKAPTPSTAQHFYCTHRHAANMTRAGAESQALSACNASVISRFEKHWGHMASTGAVGEHNRERVEPTLRNRHAAGPCPRAAIVVVGMRQKLQGTVVTTSPHGLNSLIYKLQNIKRFPRLHDFAQMSDQKHCLTRVASFGPSMSALTSRDPHSLRLSPRGLSVIRSCAPSRMLNLVRQESVTTVLQGTHR